MCYLLIFKVGPNSGHVLYSCEGLCEENVCVGRKEGGVSYLLDMFIMLLPFVITN